MCILSKGLPEPYSLGLTNATHFIPIQGEMRVVQSRVPAVFLHGTHTEELQTCLPPYGIPGQIYCGWWDILSNTLQTETVKLDTALNEQSSNEGCIYWATWYYKTEMSNKTTLTGIFRLQHWVWRVIFLQFWNIPLTGDQKLTHLILGVNVFHEQWLQFSIINRIDQVYLTAVHWA